MKTVEELQNSSNHECTITAIDIGNEGSIFTAKCLFEHGNMASLRMMPEGWGPRKHHMSALSPNVIYAEDVHTMPGQGVVSNGSLMEQKGFIRGLCASLEIRLELVRPQEWMECFTIKRVKHFATKTQWKSHLAEIAKGLAPVSLVNEINYKNADSVLIWVWAAHKEFGIPLSRKYSQLQFDV